MDYEKVYKMSFYKVYTALRDKVLRKGRTEDELVEIICWLTGYSKEEIVQIVTDDMEYGSFFQEAPCLNPDRKLITGTICGIRVETIEEPLMQEIRYLDKLVDELAKGKSMEKIFRIK
ncbi:MAG: DUF2200 domain-containing protein [Lachnospiraceae bacterium]|nr:DUF2200 domain-containing protein [Lachnospiraceae bacterium]